MKKTLILLLLSGIGLTAQADDGLFTHKQSELIKECTRLNNGKKHKAALTLLNKIDWSKLDNRQRQEISYLKATTTFAIDHAKRNKLIFTSDKACISMRRY